MTTGTKIAIGIGAAGAGFVVWRFWGAGWWSQHRGSLGFGGTRVPPRGDSAGAAIDPWNPAPATLPYLPDFPIPHPLPLGQTPELPSGLGVIGAALTSVIPAAPPYVPPPPVPPAPLATSVGVLWVPPSITQNQALAKVADLSAIYASTERPEDETTYVPPVTMATGPAVVARSGRGALLVTTGTMIGIGVGVAAVGAGAFLVMRKKTASTTGTGTGATVPGTTGGASASAPPGGGPLDVIQAIDQKGCTLIAAKSIGGATAAAGCAAYEKYLSPIALGVTLPLKAINALPLVGGPAKAIEHAVSTATPNKILSITDLPFSTSSPMANTVVKAALAPIYVGQKTLSVASHAATSAVHKITSFF